MRSALSVRSSSVINPSHDFQKVSASVFADIVTHVRKQSKFHLDNLQWHKEGYSNYDCWLLNGGKAGYALSKDEAYYAPGYRELINVFSIVSGSGNGSRIIDHVKEQSDRIVLDCYDGVFVDFYTAHEFEEFKRVANWNIGGPDVVYMRYNR